MRIVLAPNAFRGSLSALQAVEAMRSGLRAALPHAEIIPQPMADGGDGTLAVLREVLGGSTMTATVKGPLGDPVQAGFQLAADGRTALIEMAEASGLRLLPEERRDVPQASTYGTGQLISAALDAGARRILVGVGGSATIDGGCGALAALGVVFRDAAGENQEPVPAELVRLESIDLAGLDERLKETELVLAADVTTAPADCIALYGPQKGLRRGDVPMFQAFFKRLDIAARNLGKAFFHEPRYGSGGAVTGGLAVFAGGKPGHGAEMTAQWTGLYRALEGADLVITGEGSLDITSLEGKVPAVVWQAAARHRIPVIVLAGRVAPGLTLPEHVEAIAVSSGVTDPREALSRAPELVRQAARRLAERLRHDRE